MKKVTAILGLLVLGTGMASFKAYPQCKTQCEDFNIDDLEVVELEEEVELGFDTAAYLPEGFDPYQGMTTILDEIELVEIDEEVALGFDTAPYLPEGFNPYKGMIFEVDDIEVIEIEEEVILDFNVNDYLPKHFNRLSK
ncbi:hypothetical protein [Maribacter sp. 2307ULW6-5]|uniref:hypothetical protein n=1 Tax=Maribacter sp. 2307ULW6-5 TaxID=3386275 RepID=UPI0039BD7EFC